MQSQTHFFFDSLKASLSADMETSNSDQVPTMVIGEKVLLEEANKLELEASQQNRVKSECIPAFEEFEDLLHDVYVMSRPNESDYYNRKDLVRIFNEIAKEIYGKSDEIPVVEEFGSFLMDIFSSKSDLDLSVNFGNNTADFPREKKIQHLRKFSKKFHQLKRKGHVSSVQPIFNAKVPILKLVDRGTGIECDISVENRDGIVKSQIIRMISSIDERFQMLSFLTRDPPILPPFSAVLKDGTDPALVEKLVNNFLNYGKRNGESLGELFISLLIKLASIEELWPKGLCASTYEGSWILKTWDSKYDSIRVEDFTDRSQNISRAVGAPELKKIYDCIHFSNYYVSGFLNGQIQRTKLMEYLFGQELIPALEEKRTFNLGKRMTESCISSVDPVQIKKMRPGPAAGPCSEEREQPATTPIQASNMHYMNVKGWGGRQWQTATKSWTGNPTPTLSLGGRMNDAIDPPDVLVKGRKNKSQQKRSRCASANQAKADN
ncbi:protein HESO1-like isoform X2 [Diospyros lotus]|uniref:protein HESO1-like isoform X2 n=1 Tax=Diospyros lotus TaxID=55363 RepID=UPI00225567D9|nr:protein HESO1-like isoform X2 [Diospyros lotus]